MFFMCKRCGKQHAAELPLASTHTPEDVAAAKRSWLQKEAKRIDRRSDEAFAEATERSFDAYARMLCSGVSRFPSTMTTVGNHERGFEIVCGECVDT